MVTELAIASSGDFFFCNSATRCWYSALTKSVRDTASTESCLEMRRNHSLLNVWICFIRRSMTSITIKKSKRYTPIATVAITDFCNRRQRCFYTSEISITFRVKYFLTWIHAIAELLPRWTSNRIGVASLLEINYLIYPTCLAHITDYYVVPYFILISPLRPQPPTTTPTLVQAKRRILIGQLFTLPML